MKTYIQILTFLLLICSGSKAATLTGTVYSATACAPLAMTPVVMYDQYHVWSDTVWTDSNGNYSSIIPQAVYYFVDITVTAYACGTTTRTVGYSGHDIRKNLTVCGTGTGVKAKVIASGNPYINDTTYVVYLIRRNVDSATFDTTLTAVDSSYGIYNSNGDVFLETGCMRSGTYLLKAALLPNSPYYAANLPTYRDSALVWSASDTLTYGELDSQSVVTIHLVGGTNPGGPGFIGGSVSVGANKSTAVGDPLSGRILILVNKTTGKAIGRTYTDAAGKFQFSNLAYDTYEVFGDAPGKKNPVLTVTISEDHPRIDDIVFQENNKKFEGHLSSVGVARVNGLRGVSVFPNPATDFVIVKGLSLIGGVKTIVLTNITGAEISRTTSTDDARISTTSLPAGIYMLNVQTEAGNASYRIRK